MLDRVRIIEGDTIEIAKSQQIPERSIAVYFNDGDHSYRSQFLGLKLYERFLKDQALVIVDDTFALSVLHANNDFLRVNKRQWKLLFDLPSPYPREPIWWNGIHILAFNRNGHSSWLKEPLQIAMCYSGTFYNDYIFPRYLKLRAKVGIRTRLKNLVSKFPKF